MRPVAAWQSGAWSVAAAMENNLVNNAYGYEKTGEAGSTSQNRTGLRDDRQLEHAETDAENAGRGESGTAYLLMRRMRKDFSAGINALWHRVELIYLCRITKSTSSICPA